MNMRPSFWISAIAGIFLGMLALLSIRYFQNNGFSVLAQAVPPIFWILAMWAIVFLFATNVGRGYTVTAYPNSSDKPSFDFSADRAIVGGLSFGYCAVAAILFAMLAINNLAHAVR